MENKLKNKALLFWGIIFAFMILPIISVGNNIGMYFDSVFPDYAATQILDPQQFQVKWFAAFPYLCQLYHGAVGMWITVLGILITGTTSVLQHHIINLIMEFVALFLMDRVLENNGVNAMLRKGIILLLAVSPTISTIAMTQYYIELPGVICMLGTIVIFQHAERTENTVRKQLLLFLSYFVAGISVYVYFNYLFFVIGMIVYFLLNSKTTYSIGKKIVIAGYGCMAGTALYFAGYMQIAVFNITNTENILLPILTWCLVWVFCGAMLGLVIKGKDKTVFICTGVLVLMGIIVIILCRGFIASSASSLNVGGYYSAGLWGRVLIVFRNYYFALTGISAENLILQEQVSVGWKLLSIFYLLIIFVFLISTIISRDLRNITISYIGMEIIYMLCLIPFATRVQTQHFIPMIFLSFIILGMALQYIICFVKESKALSKHYFGYTATIMVITSIIVVSGFTFLLNRYRVIDRILETGGCGYYTNQVNMLAKSAMEKQQQGEKEVYIFPEWGFMSAFDYLTGNDVAFTTDCSPESIKSLLDLGYEVNIVYWQKEGDENTTDYNNLVDGMNVEIEIEDYSDYTGEVVFSDLVISTR